VFFYMEFTIYHNPRCRKSREALEYLEEKGTEYHKVKYLEDLFDKKTLGDVLKKIKLKPSEIVRKNETLWKKEYDSRFLTEDQILEILVKHPRLIERPIITTSDKGVLARPLENLIDFLK